MSDDREKGARFKMSTGGTDELRKADEVRCGCTHRSPYTADGRTCYHCGHGLSGHSGVAGCSEIVKR